MKNLVIVESPAKAKTIEKFLGKDFTVKSSYGHIRDLAKKEMSVDIDHGYEPEYEIADDKRKIVAELQKDVAAAEQVWLASDEDREGEAIAWHLQETLKPDPARTRRIVFNEITKPAILHAIENPRTVDMNLVDAQQARRVLDRLVGYEISPILWAKIKPALSAGRVQSVAVRLIVEREEEIKAFVPQSYFRITAKFKAGQDTLTAELSRRCDTEEEAAALLNRLKGATFEVCSTETKPTHRTPAPPFTTSTLQQEASRKLGFSVARTMQIAQQLYESGHITYMRTDSVNLSDTALNMAKTEIAALYGQRYVKTRRYQTKTKGAQEAHEAIRPTHMDKHTVDEDPSQRRLYELIWKRTVASQMADAELERTRMEIAATSPTLDSQFECVGEQLLFDGFLKVYIESTDDEMETTGESQATLLPRLAVGAKVAMTACDATQRYTQHAPRYTEASLVKKLEDLGIGRPSTYAPTISTILKREYIIKEDLQPESYNYVRLGLQDKTTTREVRTEKGIAEKNKLRPTDIGSVVNDFLMNNFNEIMDYNFTATVEKDFDDIADGKKQWRSVIDKFYKPFHRNILLTQQNSHRSTGARLLGTDHKSGKNVYAKIGRFGTLVQIGETNSDEKPRFASLKKGQSIETITIDEALNLFNLPRTVGTFEGSEVIVSIGKFGPYVRLGNKFYSLGKNDDPYEVTCERCIEIIETKRSAEAAKEKLKELYPHEIGILDGSPVVSNIGKYGPYLSHKGNNYRIGKNTDPLKITLDEAKKTIEASSTKKSARKK